MRKFSEIVKEYELLDLSNRNNMLFDEYHFNKYFNELIENSNNLHLDESTARYKGQFELCEFLTFELLKKHSNNCTIKFNKNELTNFDNIFFNSIKINYDSNLNNEGGYSKKLDNEFNLNDIIISVNSNSNKRYENIFSVISHELKHAWQDYHKMLVNSSIDIISSSKLYKEISQNLDKLTVKGIVSQIIYRCFDIEYDAYASEFSTEFKIELYKNNPKSLQDCLEIARKIPSYSEIFKVYHWCIYLDVHNILKLSTKTKEIKITKQELLDEINRLKNDNISWDKFKNKYINKLRKLALKICNVLANSYYEYINELENEINESFFTKHRFFVEIERGKIIKNNKL